MYRNAIPYLVWAAFSFSGIIISAGDLLLGHDWVLDTSPLKLGDIIISIIAQIVGWFIIGYIVIRLRHVYREKIDHAK